MSRSMARRLKYQEGGSVEDYERLLEMLRSLHYKDERIKTIHVILSSKDFWGLVNKYDLINALVDAQIAIDSLIEEGWEIYEDKGSPKDEDDNGTE